jgi:hypothetical protein
LRSPLRIAIAAVCCAAVLAAGGLALRSRLSDGPTSVPSCSWPLAVRGPTTTIQTGLVKCYLRALAGHDQSGLTAVQDQPARIRASDFTLSAAAKSGVATAAFIPNQVASGTVDVSIRFANGQTTSVEMVLANPASWHSWRLQLDMTGGGPAPAAAKP